MAGYRETFGANVDYAYGRGYTDMTSRLQQSMAGLRSGAGAIGQIAGQARAAQRGINDLSSRMSQLREDIARATEPEHIRRLTREFQNAQKAAENMGKKLRQLPFDALQKGMGKLVGGLIKMNSSILTIGFDFLISSIKRVYELQERWTKAIGGFNLRIGGMTKDLQGAQRAATQWSGVIRGLTDGDINEGIQMFADFTDAIGRVVEQGDQFSQFGLQMARGFNLGGQGAGQLTKVLQNIGDSGDDASETIKAMIKGANAAHVPVNLLAKDILDSSVYMARFGKEGQRTFVTGAAWARKFTISMEQLKNSVEGLDMFDDASKTASKLNAVFGTMINSMDLMLTDDPAQRLEMIRQQFLAQGTTFDKLTPKQRRYLSETLKLTEDQTAALLDASKAGESYADFQEKAARKEKQELNAKQMMEKQLRSTAQTMYAFGVAFDRITVAIANAIKPLLKVFGLAGDGSKKFKSFGEVMESITKTVEDFFNSLAGNDKWNDFMEELARDLQRAGSALKEFVLDGRAADLVGDIAQGMKSFYVTVRDLAVKAIPALRPLLDVFIFLTRHIKELVVAWAGLKVLSFAGGAGGVMGAAKGIMGSTVGRAGVAGAAGYALGGTGAGIGAAGGSLIGSALGPIGSIVGPIVGGIIGKGIEWLFTKEKVKSSLEKAQEELTAATEKQKATQESYEKIIAGASIRQKLEDSVHRARQTVLRRLEDAAAASKEKTITLNEDEARILSERASELTMFGKATKITRDMVAALGDGSKLSKDQLAELLSNSKLYDDQLKKLRDTARDLLEQQQAQLESSKLGTAKSTLESVIKFNAADLDQMRDKLKASGGQFDFKNLPKDSVYKLVEGHGDLIDVLMEQSTQFGTNDKNFYELRKKLGAKEQEQLDLSLSIRKKEKENVEAEKKLVGLQTNFMKQSTIIQLRSQVMGSSDFLKYSQEHKEKSMNEAFQSYIGEKSEDLKGLFGRSGYELLQSTPDFAIPKTAKGGVVTRPTMAMVGEAGPEAIVPLRSYNYASGGSLGGSTRVVTQIADIQLDGQKVGRALVRTSITGRA